MAKKPLKIDVGVVLKADTASLNKEGELKNKSSKIKTYIGGSEREVVTNDQTQTLENKTIDGTSATGNNTVTTDADQVTYDNSTSSLSATDTQAAIDEVESRLDTAEGAITTGATNLSNHLADAVDAHDASAISSIASGNLAATDVQSALNELQSDIDTRALASGLSDHLADTSDAHDASAISYDNSSSMLVATDAQAAIDEVEDRLDTAEGDIVTNASVISDHITDATDAHDASAISSVASGNLAAIDVQSALNELQSDIDTRALDSALTDHINDATDAHDASAISFDNGSSGLSATTVQAAIDEVEGRVDTTESTLSSHVGASTGVHGVTGVVVGTTDTQTLTNKTITGASIQTPSRLDVKQDTLANLTTYASTASNGQLCFATDTKQMFQVVDSALETVGGGGLDQWVTATNYEVGDVVWLSDDNKIYRCITLNSDVTFTPANWQELSENPYVNNLTVTAQDNLTVTDSVGTRLLKSENYELYYQDFKDVLPSTVFSSTSASLTVNDVTGTEINTSNTMASITQSGASPADSTEIVLPLPTKKQDWILTPIKILEMLEVTGGSGTFGVTLEQSSDGITFTALGSIPQLGSDVSLNKSIVQVNADSTHIKIKFSVIVADDATTLNVHRILISTDAFPVGQTVLFGSLSIPSFTTESNFIDGTIEQDGILSGTSTATGMEIRTTHDANVNLSGSVRIPSSNNFSSMIIYEDGVATSYRSTATRSSPTATQKYPHAINFKAKAGKVYKIYVNPIADSDVQTITMIATAYADNVIVDAAVSGLNTQSYTPIFSGLGTVTSVDATYRYSGDSLVLQVKATAGTVAASEMRMTLPNGFTIKGGTNKLAGYASRSTANEGVHVLYNDTLDYVQFGNPASPSGMTPQLANEVIGTGESFSFTAIVPVNELDMSSQLISLDVSSERENNYLATADRTTTNGLVNLSENRLGYIQSLTRTGTGVYVGVYKTGFFPTSPKSLATQGSAVADQVTVSIRNETATGFTAYVVDVSGVARDEAFNIFTTRGDADYRPPQAYVAGQVALTQVAYLKDVKPSGTAGGTFTSGAWQTRTLNTVEGDNIVSLSSNQFTLQKGKYLIEASAPAYKTNENKCKIRNITDGVDTILGESSYTASGDGVAISALVSGMIIVTTSKVFELQHRSATTAATSGFGTPSSFGVDEVYAQVKITKLA